MSGNSRGHVLISAGQMGGGGVRTHIQLLCKTLRQADCAVTLLGTRRGWNHGDYQEMSQAGVSLKTPPAFLARSGKLSTMYALLMLPVWLPPWKRFRSACFIGEGTYQLWLGKWLGHKTPIIYHEVVEGPEPNNPRGRCALASNAVIANSKRVAEQFLAFVGRLPVKVIPFLTAQRAITAPPPREPAGSRELRVVYLGRIIEHKRPDELVKQWKQLTSNGSLGPARLDVYGYDDGDLIPVLRQFVSENDLASRVAIHGPYSHGQLDEILRDADMVVLPSGWEGLPLVLVEAMQRGVPIVATNAGGCAEFGDSNPDVIITPIEWSDFVTGLDTMAQRVRGGIIDPVRLHQWTESRYGFEVVSRQWIEALSEPANYFHLSQLPDRSALSTVPE